MFRSTALGVGPRRRILCYGDSLTAGYCDGGRSFAPYGNALERSLTDAGTACEVSVCGLSGHTAKRMATELCAANARDICGRVGRGLQRVLDEDASPDLVVIMAGTNDLGHGTPPEEIVSHVARLHAACHARDIPTVALTAPCPAKDFRDGLAAELTRWARTVPNVLACLDTEELVPRGEGSPLWDKDTLHLTPEGSRTLGQRLARHVLPMLRRA